MKSRRTATPAVLAALAISGGSLAYSATASAQDRADAAPAPGMARMHERTTDPGMARMHERMGARNPGMARMHELMTVQNPGMARMHELMTAQNPGLARMHERMTDGSR
jgi:hypothetical protein